MNGFLRDYRRSWEDIYFRGNRSTATPNFQRFAGRHKNIKYMGERYKQFDTDFCKAFRNFDATTCIPWSFEVRNVFFRFGRKDGMHLHLKIRY